MPASICRCFLQSLVVKNLEQNQQQALNELKSWDYRALADGWQMSLFHFWWETLEEDLYKAHFGPKERNAYPQNPVDVSTDTEAFDRRK